MFEITVSTSIDNQIHISKLYKSLKDEVKSISGVSIKQNSQGRSYFSLAVKEENKEYFKAKIIDFIVSVIVNCYKLDYLKEHIECFEESIISSSFLKAVCIFDEDLDKEFIIKKLDFANDILIDSFYYFKLQELRDRWQKTVNIINFNKILYNKSSMLDILKYLTAMSECGVNKADVKISKQQITIKSLNQIKSFESDFCGCSKFLSVIIEMNPAMINLEILDNSSEEVVEVLNKIFYDKINLFQ